MELTIRTADSDFVVVAIDETLFSIFVEDFQEEYEALADLSDAFAGTHLDGDELSNMVNCFMVGYLRSAVRRARGI